jgi:hypothetical protein
MTINMMLGACYKTENDDKIKIIHWNSTKPYGFVGVLLDTLDTPNPRVHFWNEEGKNEWYNFYNLVKEVEEDEFMNADSDDFDERMQDQAVFQEDGTEVCSDLYEGYLDQKIVVDFEWRRHYRNREDVTWSEVLLDFLEYLSKRYQYTIDEFSLLGFPWSARYAKLNKLSQEKKVNLEHVNGHFQLIANQMLQHQKYEEEVRESLKNMYEAFMPKDKFPKKNKEENEE